MSRITPLPFLRLNGEDCYADADAYAKDGHAVFHKFSSIFDKPSLSLSVIIPAKDEENRLTVMLDECIDHLEVGMIYNSVLLR